MEEFFRQSIDMSNPDIFIDKIKKIEKYVRNSLEYRSYCAYIRDIKGLTKCEYFKDIWKDDSQEDITTEVHHNIFTLYDLVYIVGMKMLMNSNSKELLPIDIAKEVIKLHLEDKVSVIVLSKTIHEAFHSGLYKYSQSDTTGDYKKFLVEYYKYIPEDIFNKIKNQYDIDLKKEYSNLEGLYEKEK